LAVSGFRLRARLDFSIPSCPPGQRGITPAFGYSTPHSSAEGTSTPMTHALPSAHYEPLRHPRAPGLSLTGLRLVIPDHALGPPVLRTLPLCTCLSPLPRRSGWAYCFAHSPQPYQPSPKALSGRPAPCPFRGLLGVHLRYGLHTRAATVFRGTLSEGFSHFVTSIAAPVASGWSGCRVGLAPTGKRRLSTAHGQSGHHGRSYPREHSNPQQFF
jgi:hypothetical protein